MTGNYFYSQPGAKCFKVASNYANYVEIGVRGITDYYLEGRIEDGRFLINARLYDPETRQHLSIEDNVNSDTAFQLDATSTGYRVKNESGRVIFGIEVRVEECLLLGTIHDRDGSIIAEQRGDDFVVFHGPCTLGKEGASRGIVIQ
jgi:hypothetical protein